MYVRRSRTSSSESAKIPNLAQRTSQDPEPHAANQQCTKPRASATIKTVQLRGADERRPRRMPHTPQGGARRQRRRWAVFIVALDLAELGVQAIADPVAEDVERQDRDQDRDAREDRD